MGGWRVLDVLGKSVANLPETLVDDLLTWRHLVGIGKEQKRKREAGSEQNE